MNNYVKDYCNGCDVTVIVGDITDYGDLTHVKEVLEIIKKTVEPAPVLIVPGNHDIYVLPSEVSRNINSLHKLNMFNNLVEELGCVALMKRPYVAGSIGFVGSMGWYDYSYAPERLNLPLDAYREKAFGTRIWTDKDYVKLPFSDKEFTLYLLNKFEDHIKQVYSKVDKIITVFHHVPFRELIEYKLRPEWDYFSAFMGSESFGYVIRKYKDKIKLVVHGHQHGNVVTRICRYVDSIKVCNCASPIPLVLEI